MGILLEKLHSTRSADSADLRKTSSNAVPSCGKAADDLRKSLAQGGNPQNPQALRTRIAPSANALRKSANPHDPTAAMAGGLTRLASYAIQSGVFDHGYRLEADEIIKLVSPRDWGDADRCSNDELRSWGDALALRAIRYRGKRPEGWTQKSTCKGCGDVWLWSGAAAECDVCPWCELKRAGIWFPTPNKEVR